jgi:uncharacterized membrane protein YedE/YeeE
MRLPIESLVVSDLGAGLVVALLIGFGFGFVLERAGFGRATKLAAQFYLHDMTVFKVMFSAIVTAMIGLVVAGGVGLVDLDMVLRTGASSTFFWPMLVGGLLLGVGFIVSGYCPGTSVVASASGNIDGMLTFLGVVVGSVIYGEIYPLIASFATSSDWGQRFIPDALGVSRAVVSLVVTVVAILAFLGAEAVERIARTRWKLGGAGAAQDEPVSSGRDPGRRAALATLAVAAVAGLAVTPVWPAPAASSIRHPDGIDAGVLAHRVVETPWSIRVLDLRGEQAWTKARIPGSEPVDTGALDRLGLRFVEPGVDLVVVDSRTVRTLPAEIAAYRGRVLSLRGGFPAWERYALTTPRPPTAGASEAERGEHVFRAALNAFLTGQQAAAPPPPVRTVGPRRSGGGGGCS